MESYYDIVDDNNDNSNIIYVTGQLEDLNIDSLIDRASEGTLLNQ